MQLWFESVPDDLWSYKRPALFVGHPGHELKILGWLAENKPWVHVLTDGSGTSGLSRLPATTRLLEKLGAKPGEVFGPFSDAEIYRAILYKDLGVFCSIVDRLAHSLAEHGIDFLVADAAEGFNPTHDICRQLACAAVAKARTLTGRRIASYEFSLTEWETDGVVVHNRQCWHLRLGDRLLRLKVDAARDYAELRSVVDQAIALKGEEYFRIECLRKAASSITELPKEQKPYYEKLGNSELPLASTVAQFATSRTCFPSCAQFATTVPPINPPSTAKILN